MSRRQKLKLKLGGTLSPEQDIYISRSEDAELYNALLGREYCNVLTSRQMGKSSLMIQTASKLKQCGVRYVIVDVGGQLGQPDEAAEWYKGLLEKVSRDLALGLDIEAWWNSSGAQTRNQKLLRFFRDEIITRINAPVVIFLDEIDSTLRLPYSDDLFTAIRTMYNERPLTPAYRSITFCLLGVAIPNELIKNPLTTPYNIGKTIELRDFDFGRDDLSLLSRAVAPTLPKGRAIVKEILQVTGGQPYLTIRLCYEFVQHQCFSPDEVYGLLSKLFSDFDAVRMDVHFQQIARYFGDPDSDKLAGLSAYREVWRGRPVDDVVTAPLAKLKLSGLVKREAQGRLIVRNEIYRRIFNESWVNTTLLTTTVPASSAPQRANDRHIFISHAAADDDFVSDLRKALEGLGLSTWVDSRNLIRGSSLAPEVEQAIAQARQVIVVLSQRALNSPFMRREIQLAQRVEQKRRHEGYRLVPLLLPDIDVAVAMRWFEEEPLTIPIRIMPRDLTGATPALLAALGERLPADLQALRSVAAEPVEELLLRLTDPSMRTVDGTPRVTATATLSYIPAYAVYDPSQAQPRPAESRRFVFTAPLGPIEADDLRWYLESYYQWPTGVFQERASRLEMQLPQWGRLLYHAALGAQVARETFTAWSASNSSERRFSIVIDSDLPEGSSPDEQANARAATARLLALPWELLHDGRSYLFQGQRPALVRRRLARHDGRTNLAAALPIRVLLAAPRPEDEQVAYVDHRSSALPLIEAVEQLGALVDLTVLTRPTFAALQKMLRAAVAAGQPFTVVHFDGQGAPAAGGQPGLWFEAEVDVDQALHPAAQRIEAEQFAALMRDHRVPVIFLSANQRISDDDVTASLAATLNEAGVPSVVTMSYNVLFETTRRFVEQFYARLARGARLGAAMLAGQQALYADSFRRKVPGAGELRLQDWFVPVLYQGEDDPQLITALPRQEIRQLQEQQRLLMMGALPPTPPHHFQGRSRELLTLERLLVEHAYVVLRGQGGAGKTTLAVELARWLVRIGRFRRAAFVSVEQSGDERTVLDAIGRQLAPNYSVAQYKDQKEALQPIERALRDAPTIIVLDNLERILPDAAGRSPAGAPVEELLALYHRLLVTDPATRIVFTSREALPAPFDKPGQLIELGALSRADAIELVSQVMAQEGLVPESSDPGATADEIIELVEAVNRHARALVLLAREVARRGVRATADNLRQLMADLERAHPGDRENSLYASVELSLRRLTPEQRKQVRKLGVFHGGAQFGVIMYVLGLDEDATRALLIALIDVGLGEDMGYGHLRLDPALPPYLLNELSEDEQREEQERWAGGMIGLTQFLYQQRSQNAALAAQLTILELANLLALLSWVEHKLPPEQIVDIANNIETLLARLGRPSALQRVVAFRERAAQGLGTWSHAQFLTASATLDRLLEQGDVPQAHTTAQRLLERALSAGEAAYHGAAADIATAYLRLGRVLNMGGAVEQALQSLAEARRRFRTLADAGDDEVARMATLTLYQTGDALRALGRLDEATSMYEEGISQNQRLGAWRDVALGKVQLGAIRSLQGRYRDALDIYDDARQLFETVGEPPMIGVIRHQIGTLYRRMRMFEEAEQAYRQSLAIRVQMRDLPGQADTLLELGHLYRAMDRLEEAAIFYQQAADIYVGLRDLFREGQTRSNLAATLIQLQRYDNARQELLRAIETMQPYGHAAEPWEIWMTLHGLELATNNVEAAVEARGRAIEAYLAYRRAGGENRNPGAQLCAQVFQAIQSVRTAEVEQRLTESLDSDVPPWAQALFPKLIAILQGDRDPALADDPSLDYDDAAELILLLEALKI